MAQRAYLLTSPEKFQLEHGNGSSNMDYLTAIGQGKLGGVKKTAALFLPLDKGQNFPSADIFPSSPQTKVDHNEFPVNGLFGATATKPLTWSEIINRLKKLS